MAAPMCLHHVQSTILQNPVFEGSEKRLEIDFFDGLSGGLRNLPRSALDELMELAACTIVSSRSNPPLDAYVLSESSLFVYPNKWVLKTCGTTQLLKAVPRLMELTSELGLKPCAANTLARASYFPEQQPFPHSAFDDEVRYLDNSLNGLLATGLSSVLGEQADGLQWHVYIASTLVCLGGSSSACDKFISTQQTTADSGILKIKPNALIDDYVFEPCGYSMNGIEGCSHMTIHVTPEPGFSYASFELSGSAVDIGDPSQQLAAAVSIFQPGRLTVALATNCDSLPGDFGASFKPPANYRCSVVHHSKLPGGGCVNYVTMTHGPLPASPRTVLGLSHPSASDFSGSTAAELDSSSSDPETMA